MAILSFCGKKYTVDHAVKGVDYIHGYDAAGLMLVSFEGVTDFSLFSYDGTYMDPSACATEVCNGTILVGGALKTKDGRAVTPAHVGALSKSGDTMTGALAMSGNKITGLGTPTDASDAATKACVDTKIEMDALWYNPSPRSTFAAQKIAIDLSGYSYIAIIPNYNDDATRRGPLWLSQSPSSSAGFMSIVMANDAIVASRRITNIETDGITFSDAYVSTKGAAGTANNKYCVPLQVFGFKGVH